MANFIHAAFQASRALGGPYQLARHLGVQPDELFRWIAGLDLPAERERRELERRMSVALVSGAGRLPAQRRHGDLLS
jgi:DNA-binding transcriptional regulator YdaS (Cro superfamily)